MTLLNFFYNRVVADILSFIKIIMASCFKIDDLEDLADNLFDFDEDQPRIHKEKALKKQRKPKVQTEQKTDEQKEEELEEKPLIQKAPGTHSIYVKTFGCSHNISDSQFMIGQLNEYGYQIVDSANEADLVLINSCTVVNPSQDAFISMVSKAKKIKKPIVVAGCVPQGDSTIPQLADVSAVGVTQIDRIVQVVQETLKGHKVQLMTKKQLPSLDLPKIRKNKDIQIIAINAGCLGACTYCKTVFARGKLISYTSDAIVQRVRTVVKEGVKEIWLTSEDTGAYGRDIGTNISELLIRLSEELQNHEGIMMRIGMTNPPYMLDQLSSIGHFLKHPRVFGFIHIPIQAGHNNVLQKMNREYTVEQFRQVADYFIEHVPNVTIATDIICGFPEETDQEFESSLELITHYKFKVVYINQFYLRPGTPAANFKQLPTKTIKSRSNKLTDLFKSYNKHEYLIGREQRVWINEEENYKGQLFLVGHTKNYTKVIIPHQPHLLYKQVIMKITRAFEWHVEGEIVNENPEFLPIPAGYVEQMKRDVLEQLETIKKRKDAKLIKMKERKEKLIQERLKREDVSQTVYKETIQSATQPKKSCCNNKQECKCSEGGGCCSNKQISSCCQTKAQNQSCCSTKNANESCCQTQTQSLPKIQKPILVTEKVQTEAKIQQKQQGVKAAQKSQPIYLVIAIILLSIGLGLLALQ